MAGEWQETTWGRLAVLEYGRALRTYGDTRNFARVFGTNGPIGWHSEPLWNGPGVIVGRKGAYRGVHYSEGPYWVIDTAYSLQPKKSLNIRWAYYQLKSIDLNSVDDGSPIPSTTRPAFYALPVKLPPRAEQDRIADLLSALDDKIELNRRMAETLEGTARALFKSWFIDFDPVRAKAEGRATGLPNDLAALFPDRLEEDELPAGWEPTSIETLAEVNPYTSLKAGSVAPYVDMAALPTRSARIEAWIERSAGSGARFRNGDTLIARITPCLENGKTAIVDFLPDGQVGWGSTEFIVVRPRPNVPAAVPYLLARHEPFRSHLIAAMTGTSGRQRAPAAAVTAWTIARPTSPVLAAFGEIVDPLFERIRAADAENRTLVSLRDALLPRLISGELRIADAQKRISAA